jgi:hypothetical protein
VPLEKGYALARERVGVRAHAEITTKEGVQEK